MMPPRLLIVHPDLSVVFRLDQPLRGAGFEVMTATTLLGMQRKLVHPPDLIILSLLFGPDMVLPVIRSLWRSRHPTLVLHRGESSELVVQAFAHDALDVIAENVEFDELTARIRRGIRLATWSLPLTVADEVLLLLDQQLVMVRGTMVKLTPLETRLLTMLAMRQGQVVTHQTLLDGAWSIGEEPTVANLWVRMRGLRAKLERDPRRPHYIQTVRGIGYSFVRHPK